MDGTCTTRSAWRGSGSFMRASAARWHAHPRNRRRWIPRFASLRPPARAGPPGGRDGQLHHRQPFQPRAPQEPPELSADPARRRELHRTGGAARRRVPLCEPGEPGRLSGTSIQTLKVGSLGTHKALGLAKAKRARFLLASTSEVYGDPLVHPQPESYWGNVNPVGPRGVYDEAKRFAEAIT